MVLSWYSLTVWEIIHKHLNFHLWDTFLKIVLFFKIVPTSTSYHFLVFCSTKKARVLKNEQTYLLARCLFLFLFCFAFFSLIRCWENILGGSCKRNSFINKVSKHLDKWLELVGATQNMRLSLNFIKIYCKNTSLYATLRRSRIICCGSYWFFFQSSLPPPHPISKIFKFNECVPLCPHELSR